MKGQIQTTLEIGVVGGLLRRKTAKSDFTILLYCDCRDCTQALEIAELLALLKVFVCVCVCFVEVIKTIRYLWCVLTVTVKSILSCNMVCMLELSSNFVGLLSNFSNCCSL